MLVELEDLKLSPENQLDFDFNEFIAELGNDNDVTGRVNIKLMPYGVKVTGSVSTDVELICDRCLSNYTLTLKAKVNEDFLFGTLLPEGVKEHELQGQDFVNELNNETCIDITDLIYQSIVLELPNQNLCSHECQGTKEYQSLKDEMTDPRLEQFKNINISSN